MGDARQEGKDVQHWGRVIRRHKWLLLAIVVLIPAAVYGLSRALPKTYESSSTLHIQQTGSGATLFSTVHTNASDAEETATLAKTTLVGSRAARILGQPPATARALTGQIQVNPATPGETKGSFLTIAAQNSDPKRAAKVANAFAKAIVRVRTGSAIHSIDRTIAALTNARKKLEDQGNKEDQTTQEEVASQLQQLRGLKASQAGTTTIVERAVPAASPGSPKPLRNTLLALLAAVLIAAALVPLLDRLDRRLRDSDDLEELIEQPLLATIPDAAFPGHAPDWHVREAFQTLRAGLVYFNVDRRLATLVVTSPAQWDGKTTVAVNLAAAYALDGQDVILLDADLRRPQVAGRLGVQPAIGLEAVLAGERTVDEALIEIDAGGGRMRILPGRCRRRTRRRCSAPSGCARCWTNCAGRPTSSSSTRRRCSPSATRCRWSTRRRGRCWWRGSTRRRRTPFDGRTRSWRAPGARCWARSPPAPVRTRPTAITGTTATAPTGRPSPPPPPRTAAAARCPAHPRARPTRRPRAGPGRRALVRRAAVRTRRRSSCRRPPWHRSCAVRRGPACSPPSIRGSGCRRAGRRSASPLTPLRSEPCKGRPCRS